MKTTLKFLIAGGMALAASTIAASSEPIELTLTNFAPPHNERLTAWAERVSRNSAGTISVTLHDRSTPLGSDPRAQLTQLQNGESDIALFWPSYFPERFPDADIGYMPGQFDDPTEASIALLRVVKQGAMRGFDDLYVLTCWRGGSGSSFIHSASPIDDLGALRGTRVRIAATIVAPMLEALGAEAVFLPINKARAALESGEIDAVLTGIQPLYSADLMDVTRHHLAIPMGGLLFVIAMKQDRFEALPEAAQSALLAHMGEAFARDVSQSVVERFLRRSEEVASRPDHNIRILSDSERETWLAAAQAAINSWVAADPDRQAVLDASLDEAMRVRIGQ